MKKMWGSKLSCAYAQIRSNSFEYKENQGFSSISISGEMKI